MLASTRSLATLAPGAFNKGDWNAFLTLGTDNLAKIVILPAILIGTFHMAPAIVFGRIMPGLGLTLLLGLAIFAYLSLRLAAREGRSDVTALPYGISTPSLFVYLFGIIGPVYFASGDPVLAYRLALGAAFLGGLIELSGALIGPLLQRITPKAGIMGTMAGVAIVWIAMIPTAIIFANPLIGLPVLFVVLLGLLGGYQFPLKLPAGLVAIILGVVLGFVTGDSTLRFDDMAFYPPLPVIGDLWAGLSLMLKRPDVLAVVLPIAIYNVIETTGNVESARLAGDTYDNRTCQLIDGLGTCLGAAFGSPFPTSVYLGHPAYKKMGGRTGYVLLTGIFLFGAALIGLFAFLQHLIPAAAISSLLVFVGIVMTNYAFQAAPAAHGAAVALALVPHIADLLKKQLDGTMLEIFQEGSATVGLVSRLADNQGVYLESYGLLSRGAIITGLLWGAILAFLIDRDLRRATLWSLLASGLSLVGLIHAERIGISLSPVTKGYLVLTAILALLYLVGARRGAASGDEAEPIVSADESDSLAGIETETSSAETSAA
jgi:AGZA family xanthine/uracil permease-like MFS transporter